MIDFEDIEGLSEEVKAKLAEKVSGLVSKEELDKVIENRDKILREAKAAKDKARNSEANAAAIAAEKALKDGDFESYRKSSEERLALLSSELDSVKTQSKREKINSISKDFISTKYKQDPLILESLTNKFAARLDVREGKTVVLNDQGELTSISVDDLKKEFLNNAIYKSHLIATKATGGGATGSSDSGSGAPEISLKQAKTKADRLKIIDAHIKKVTSNN